LLHSKSLDLGQIIMTGTSVRATAIVMIVAVALEIAPLLVFELSELAPARPIVVMVRMPVVTAGSGAEASHEYAVAVGRPDVNLHVASGVVMSPVTVGAAVLVVGLQW
jgi:hypothetical protein